MTLFSEVTSDSGITERDDGVLLSLGGNLYYIGGDTSDDDDPEGYDYSNTVYVSEDGGETWSSTYATGHFTPRWNFAACVFDNKMWVIGGQDENGYCDDVWYSSDGVTWTDAGASGHWDSREGLRATVLGSKLYISGGRSGEFGDIYNTDVWSTENGSSWTQETSDFGGAGRFRHGFVTLGTTMYIVLGHTGGGDDYASDVYSSTDGAIWSLVTSDFGHTTRGYFQCLAHGDSIYVIGGGLYLGSYTSEVLSSTDGETWTDEGDGEFTARIYHSCCTDGTYVYMMMGST